MWHADVELSWQFQSFLDSNSLQAEGQQPAEASPPGASTDEELSLDPPSALVDPPSAPVDPSFVVEPSSQVSLPKFLMPPYAPVQHVSQPTRCSATLSGLTIQPHQSTEY